MKQIQMAFQNFLRFSFPHVSTVPLFLFSSTPPLYLRLLKPPSIVPVTPRGLYCPLWEPLYNYQRNRDKDGVWIFYFISKGNSGVRNSFHQCRLAHSLQLTVSRELPGSKERLSELPRITKSVCL